MSNKKISELTALTTIAVGDLFPIVDISDTTDSSAGTTKKITLTNVLAGILANGNFGTAGYLFFAGAAGTLAQDTTAGGQIFWDGTNHRMGLGNAAPTVTLDVTGAGKFSSTLTASSGFTLTTGALSLTASSGSVALTLTSNTNAFIINTNLLVVDTTNSRIGIGVTLPLAKVHVHVGTNRNLFVYADGYVSGDTTLGAINDANSAGVPLSFYASVFGFSNGNVGIGTTTVSHLLHVAGTIAARSATSTRGYAAVNMGGASNAGYLEIYKSGPTRIGYIGFDNTNVTCVSENSAAFVFSGSGTTTISNGLLINSGSIQVSTAGGSLFVGPSGTSATDAYFGLSNAADWGITNSATGDTNISAQAGKRIVFGTNTSGTPTLRVVIDSSGNVAIGTTSASAKLHCLATTEQLRLGYDTSNYFSTTIDSSGNATHALTGTSPIHTFSNNIKVLASGAAVTVNDTASLPQFFMQENGTTTVTWFSNATSLFIRANRSGSTIQFQPSGTTTRVTIDASGNLGIGATPTALLSVAEKFLVNSSGLVTKHNNVVTAGWGLASIYASARSTAQTAAVASVATYTVGAADGSFIISCNVNVTTSTTHSFSVQVDYTDETNTARTLTLSVQQLAGTMIAAITNVTGAGPYEGVPVQIRCKAATSITIKTTGTFTTVTYNVEGAIIQIA